MRLSTGVLLKNSDLQHGAGYNGKGRMLESYLKSMFKVGLYLHAVGIPMVKAEQLPWVKLYLR